MVSKDNDTKSHPKTKTLLKTKRRGEGGDNTTVGSVHVTSAKRNRILKIPQSWTLSQLPRLTDVLLSDCYQLDLAMRTTGKARRPQRDGTSNWSSVGLTLSRSSTNTPSATITSDLSCEPFNLFTVSPTLSSHNRYYQLMSIHNHIYDSTIHCITASTGGVKINFEWLIHVD